MQNKEKKPKKQYTEADAKAFACTIKEIADKTGDNAAAKRAIFLKGL